MSDPMKTGDPDSPVRIRFTEDEEKFPWLSMLFQGYAIIDEGVAAAVKAEEDDFKGKLACKDGCDQCCRTHRDIPMYPLEVLGISWYVTEKIAEPLRSVLRDQLRNHGEGDPCPFLINRSCSIHLLRPAACRQFNVFSEACEEGEDPYFTRREDVLTPKGDYVERAFSVMLPFYGVREGVDRIKAARSLIQGQALNLQSFDWANVVSIMEDFDSKKAGR